MNAKVLCNWLEIPDWPPDHYALLGLKPGEQDAACIERHVHERMARLRCYQISYPEEATEGMNRVAQAFICVSEALAKAPCPKCEPATKKISDDTLTHLATDSKTEVNWKTTPPPVRGIPAGVAPVVGQATAAPIGKPARLDEPAEPQVADSLATARRGL